MEFVWKWPTIMGQVAIFFFFFFCKWSVVIYWYNLTNTIIVIVGYIWKKESVPSGNWRIIVIDCNLKKKKKQFVWESVSACACVFICIFLLHSTMWSAQSLLSATLNYNLKQKKSRQTTNQQFSLYFVL